MSVEILREMKPIARKQHKCFYCGATIEVGQKYNRATCLYDGRIYDWISHVECQEVAEDLDMFSMCDDNGLDGDSFSDYISEYVYENHYDDSLDDIAEEWQLSTHEQVLKIHSELKIKNVKA